jgi:hypothetical protein
MNDELSAILAALMAEDDDELRRRYQWAHTNVVQSEPEPLAGLNAFQTDAFQNNAFE